MESPLRLALDHHCFAVVSAESEKRLRVSKAGANSQYEYLESSTELRSPSPSVKLAPREYASSV